jgi:CHASE2 domain-containing sensor protein
MPTPDLLLFVSHVSEDRQAALEIVDELEQRGVPCWIAPRDVHPGKPFDDEIAEAIEASRAMLLIFSDHCNEHEYIRREITVAGESRKVIIPFRIEDAEPRRGLRVRLSDLHWIDGFVSRERAIDQVVRTIDPARVQQQEEEERRLAEEGGRRHKEEQRRSQHQKQEHRRQQTEEERRQREEKQRQTHLWDHIAKISSSASLKAFTAANFIVALIIVVRAVGLLQPLELAIYDALRVAWAGDQPSNRVILVGATEDDIARWHWPLRDSELAELLDRLASWKPRAIGVDLYRDRPEAPGSDQLVAVLARHPEIFWVFKLGGENDRGVLAPEPLRHTDRAVLADILVDPGGIVRRGLLYADDGVENYAALGVALALLYLAPEGIRLRPESGDRLRLGKTLISRLNAAQGPYMRLDDRGYQILLDYHGGPAPFRRVSIADVMDRNTVASLVRDRIVIIGSAAESVRELFMTPFSSEVTGLGIPPITGIMMHGYLADQLIRGALDGEPSLGALTHRAEMIWIYGWAIAGTVLAIAVRRPIPALTATFAGLAVLAAIVYEAFGMAFLLPALPAGFAWVGAAGLSNRVLIFERWWRLRYIQAERRRV